MPNALRQNLFLLPASAHSSLLRMSWRPLVACYGFMLLASMIGLGVDAMHHPDLQHMAYDSWQLSWRHSQWAVACLLFLMVFVRPKLLPRWQQALYQHRTAKTGLAQLQAQSAQSFYLVTLPALAFLTVCVILLFTFGFTMMFLDDFVFTGYWPWFYTHATMFALMMLGVNNAYWALMYLCLKQHLLLHGLQSPLP
ncbi:MAG TPA: hypothetical protein PK856_05045 [Vitreoscilla sp.]|nr:hypothetical protein [Vitreoscilla sp.]